MKSKIKNILIILFLIVIFVAIFIFQKESPAGLTKKAIENKDISLCDKIDDQGDKNQCYFKLSEFIPEACNKIDPFYCRGSPCFSDSPLIGQCYLNLYEKTKNENYCIKMESQGGDNEYIKTCFTKSNHSGDSLCKKFISSYHNFWDCYVNDLKIGPNVTEEICRQFSQISEDDKTRCYEDLARVTKNEEYCNLCTYRLFTKYYCIIDVALAKKDDSLCNKLPSDCFHCRNGDSCPEPTGTGWIDCKSFKDFCIETVKNCTIDSFGVWKC